MADVPVTRRTFLAVSLTTAGGLLVTASLGGCGEVQPPFSPGPFVRLDPDGSVTVAISKSEMGQGVTRALALLVAEELAVDWSTIRIERAALNESLYGEQSTGGSSTVRLMWLPMRQAGAAARMMLVAAAARRWNVSPESCTADAGRVRHAASGRDVAYTGLLAAAAGEPVPGTPVLRDARTFRMIGTARRDPEVQAIVTGTAVFGCDVRVPGMRFAAILRPPAVGAVLAGFDGSAASAIEGVEQIVEVPAVDPPVGALGGVAVVARDTWTAFRGRDAIRADWTLPDGPPESTDAIRARIRESLGRPGSVASERGSVDAALRAPGSRIVATYELPFISQAPMEPMNCTASVDGGTCTLWAPTQFPILAAQAAATALGIAERDVSVNVTRMGGAFGRRINSDYAAEAALVARAAGVPVQVMWSREDDMRHGFYRPMVAHRVEAVLQPDGFPHVILHRVAGTSAGPAGATHIPYRVAHHRCESTSIETRIRRGWWRAVSHNHTSFAVETFINELAAAAGRDPVDYRLDLIDGTSPMPLRPIEAQGEEHEFDPERLAGVIRLASDRAGWGSPVAAGSGRGFACWWCMASYAAEVVDVTVRPDGQLIIDRVTAAFDCGTVVDPLGAEAQAQGGITSALSAAIGQEITVSDGRVDQGNFDTYPLLRIDRAPRRIDAHFVPSDRPPSGLGEQPVPPAAPALVAAIHQATGRWIRRLPTGNPLRPGA